MLERQVTGQSERLFSKLFVFLLVLLEKLLRPGESLFMVFDLPPQQFAGFAESSIFIRQLFRTSPLRVAGPKEIPGNFKPRSLVLPNRFLRKSSSLLRSFAWLSRK